MGALTGVRTGSKVTRRACCASTTSRVSPPILKQPSPPLPPGSMASCSQTDERIFAPQPGRRALLRLAETNIAFTQPDDAKTGPPGTFLTPPTPGVHSLVWCVEDERAAQTFFHRRACERHASTACQPASP